ncbi:MAG: hypothetical protein ACFFDN_23880 [Candidatus Hodarchaeota archaeon]
MIEIKIEIIFLTRMAGQLVHHSSTETKKIKIEKKEFFQEALQYIEQYVDKSGFKIFSIDSETGGVSYFLIKE